MSEDPYSVGKSSLRDAAKTLILIYSGLAAGIIAGTPFIGKINSSGSDFQYIVNICLLIISFALLSVASYLLVRLLQSDSYFAKNLLSTSNLILTPDFVGPPRKRFLGEDCFSFFNVKNRIFEKLNLEYSFNISNLMPEVGDSYDSINNKRIEAWKIFEKSKSNSALKSDYEYAAADVHEASQWIIFNHIKHKYCEYLKIVFILGFISLLLLSILGFHIKGNEKNNSNNISINIPEYLFSSREFLTKNITLDISEDKDLNASDDESINEIFNILSGSKDLNLIIYAYHGGDDKFDRLVAIKKKNEIIEKFSKFGKINNYKLITKDIDSDLAYFINKYPEFSGLKSKVHLLLFQFPYNLGYLDKRN